MTIGQTLVRDIVVEIVYRILFVSLFCSVRLSRAAVLPQILFYQLLLMLCENGVYRIKLNDHIHENGHRPALAAHMPDGTRTCNETFYYLRNGHKNEQRPFGVRVSMSSAATTAPNMQITSMITQKKQNKTQFRCRRRFEAIHFSFVQFYRRSPS